jgi:hypothetical protein
LPWNKHKTWMGLAAFFVSALLGCIALVHAGYMRGWHDVMVTPSFTLKCVCGDTAIGTVGTDQSAPPSVATQGDGAGGDLCISRVCIGWAVRQPGHLCRRGSRGSRAALVALLT